MSGRVGAQVEIEKEQATSDDRFAHACTRTRTGSLARVHTHECTRTHARKATPAL